MADPLLGEDLIISVEDPNSPGTYVEVTNMDNYSRTSTREVKSTRVFNKTRPIKTPSRITDDAFQISGLNTPADEGQTILKTAEEAGTSVVLRVLPDGVNGFTQEVLLTQLKDDGTADDYQKVAYDCTAVGDAQDYNGP